MQSNYDYHYGIQIDVIKRDINVPFFKKMGRLYIMEPFDYNNYISECYIRDYIHKFLNRILSEHRTDKDLTLHYFYTSKFYNTFSDAKKNNRSLRSGDINFIILLNQHVLGTSVKVWVQNVTGRMMVTVYSQPLKMSVYGSYEHYGLIINKVGEQLIGICK